MQSPKLVHVKINKFEMQHPCVTVHDGVVSDSLTDVVDPLTCRPLVVVRLDVFRQVVTTHEPFATLVARKPLLSWKRADV